MEGRVTQKELQSERTRAILRDAVTEVLFEKGIDRFTIQDICTKANVAVGTFYKYYKNKDDVINDRYSVMDDYFRNEVAATLAKMDPAEGLFNFAKLYHGFTTRASLQVGRQVVKARLSGVEGRAQSRERPLFEILDGIFRQGQAAGQIRDDVPPTQLSDMFMILLRGYSFYHCAYGKIVPEGQSYEQHISLWLDAFKPLRS